MLSSDSHGTQICHHRDDILPTLGLCTKLPAPLDFHKVQANNHLDALPNELLGLIVYKAINNPFDIYATLANVRTISRIARTCRRLYSVANPILYRWSIRHGSCTGLFWAARKDRVDVFKRFVEGGASVNMVVTDRTPAMTAVTFSSTDIVRYLLTLPEVDWNRTSTHHGMAPLHVAMACPTEITKLLLTCKDVSIDEKTGWERHTALHYASMNNMVSEAKTLLERGADPDARTHCGWSPLNFAAARGHTDMVRLLLETGKVNINVNPEDGQPPLAAAAVKGHKDIFDMLISHPDIDIEVVLSCDYTKKNMDEIPSDLFNRLIMEVAGVVEGDEQ
ncbi:putative ankyrin repeat protein [Trichoderma atroviride IMI 206040]|uniref:Ankyrin repeat protein n=1 Tax=Hypocrea atroviridis (strain ATCC 20476 / IMI 206040) TaxID=452589 RepID=G9P2R1_HYPAI|nr:putative ankyrin repeat protein [Trichoderma atroviride IMI 206040]EHK42741.1 putative ankyrin repeat protein [Trichoderma atroviride IMI 206040]